MKGEYDRTLINPVRNPRFNAMFRRGLLSVRQFHKGLPFVVHRLPDQYHNYFSLFSKITVDIPALKLFGLNEASLIEALWAASMPLLSKLPEGETHVACPNCNGYLWRNKMTQSVQQPVRSICIACGTEIGILRLFHAPGRA